MKLIFEIACAIALAPVILLLAYWALMCAVLIVVTVVSWIVDL